MTTCNNFLNTLGKSVFSNTTKELSVNYKELNNKNLNTVLEKFKNNITPEENLDYFLNTVLPNSTRNINQLCQLFGELFKANIKNGDATDTSDFIAMFSTWLYSNSREFDAQSIQAKCQELPMDMRLLGSIIHYLLFNTKDDLTSRIMNVNTLLQSDFHLSEDILLTDTKVAQIMNENQTIWSNRLNIQRQIKRRNNGLPRQLLRDMGVSDLTPEEFGKLKQCDIDLRRLPRNMVGIVSHNKEFVKKVQRNFAPIFPENKNDNNNFISPIKSLSEILSFEEIDYTNMKGHDDIRYKSYTNTFITFSNVWNTMKRKLQKIDLVQFLQNYILLVNILYVNNIVSDHMELAKYFVKDDAFKYVLLSNNVARYWLPDPSTKKLSDEYIKSVYQKLSSIKYSRNITRLIQQLSSNTELDKKLQLNLSTIISYNIDLQSNTTHNMTQLFNEKYKTDSEKLICEYNCAQFLFNALIYYYTTNYEKTVDLIDKIKGKEFENIKKINELLDNVEFDKYRALIQQLKDSYHVGGIDVMSRKDIRECNIVMQEFKGLFSKNIASIKKIYQDFIVYADTLANWYLYDVRQNLELIEISNKIMTYKKDKCAQDDYTMRNWITDRYCEKPSTHIGALKNAAAYDSVKQFKDNVLKNIQDSDTLSDLLSAIYYNEGFILCVSFEPLNIIFRSYANKPKEKFKPYDALEWANWAQKDNAWPLLFAAFMNCWLENPNKAQDIMKNMTELKENNDTAKLQKFLESINYSQLLDDLILPVLEKNKTFIINEMCNTQYQFKDRNKFNDWIYNRYKDENNDINDEKNSAENVFKKLKDAVKNYQPTIKDYNKLFHRITQNKFDKIIKTFIGTANIFYQIYEYNKSKEVNTLK